MTHSPSRVESVLAARKAAARGSLVGFLPVGFPTLDVSIEAAITLAENGVDIIELGIPYSDPVMDGPMIQAASQASLDAGFRLSQAFEAVAAITERTAVPVLLMSYWNPILQFGVDRFAEALAEAGGAGIITADLIPDDAEAWMLASNHYGLDRVFLAAPSSSDERLSMIVAKSTGFVYAVSTMGITGARAEVDGAARSLVGRLRAAGAKHVCVGLGISSVEQVDEVLEYADGAIVGSALVKALASGGVQELATAAASLSGGTRLN